MPSPGPPGEPFRIVAMSPLTPGTFPVHVDPAEVVDAAAASGRIGPADRDHWLREVRAAGRAGANAIMAMLELPDSDAAAEATYAALYPDSPPPRPATEPDWVGMTDTRLAWLQHNAAAGPAHHEIVNHEPVTVREHEHAHSDYNGSTHVHRHGHAGDKNHSPFSAHHAHQPLASDPVAAGIQAWVSATAAADLTDDQLYERLYGG